eukprot:m.7968 g.7968  ORF g.7968 m.7968 type:complete len:206 (-) comp3809_c0_seq1:111-728(-)
MSLVWVQNVEVINNGAKFTDDFQFEVTFECSAALEHDIEWKVIYVGSAESEEHDQELESIMVGPVPIGVSRFVLEAPAPNTQKIPPLEIRGVTVVLITCSYNGHEFVRIGYYVNNDYEDPELREEPPETLDIDKLQRHILATKPKVTRYHISWDEPTPSSPTGSRLSPGTNAEAGWNAQMQHGIMGATPENSLQSQEHSIPMECN